MSFSSHNASLPWSGSLEDERRFRKIFAVVMGLAFLLGALVPILQIPEVERIKKITPPPHLAKLILERKQIPKPVTKPVAVKVTPPQAKAKPKPAPKPTTEPKTQPKPTPVAKARPLPKPAPDPAAARKKAANSGLLAFADDLADLRSAPAVSSVKASRTLVKGGNQAKQSQRALVTAGVTGGSGGIDTAKLSRDTGGVGLSGRKVTQVSSAVPGNAGGGAAASQSRNRDDRGMQRTSEEIQMVFDRNKGAVYAIYNRALRNDPMLRGKVVLEVTIAPSGAVTAARIISSDLDNPKLERKLLARVKMFNFSAKDVATTVVSYPIDFLPS